MRISDWSSDVCSSDLPRDVRPRGAPAGQIARSPPRAKGQRHSHRTDGAGSGVWPTGRRRARIEAKSSFPRQKPGHLLSASHRSEEHTSELQSLMRISYAVFCLKKKKTLPIHDSNNRFVHTKHTK